MRPVPTSRTSALIARPSADTSLRSPFPADPDPAKGPRSNRTRAAASAAAPTFEALEGRQFMSASISNGVLNIVGTDGPDLISLGVKGPNLQVLQGLNLTQFALSSFSRIRVDGLGGNDFLLSNDTVTKPTDFYGGAGNDTIHGGGGNDGIYGGADVDTLTGGGGADRFLVFPNTDVITDLRPEDARVNFSNNGVQWSESEIVTVDQGLSALVNRTGNTRILKLKSGGELTFQRVASLSSDPTVTTLADNDSAGHIRVASPVFQGGRNAPTTIIHEVGHDWDDEGPLWNDWQALSGWQSVGTGSPVPVGYVRATDLKGNAQPFVYLRGTQFARPDGYGKTNPKEDFASSLETFFSGANAPANWQAKYNFIQRFLNTEQFNWYGEIGAKYDQSIGLTDAGGRSVRSVLGFPTSYEQDVPGKPGARMQSFEGGDIVWSPGTGAHVVYGAIGGKFRQTASLKDAFGNSVKNVLGLPLTDEQPVQGVAGARVNFFQNGAIYWSPGTGPHVVYGAIGAKYQASASLTDAFGRSVKSLLGLPTSDEMAGPNGGRVSYFQGGAIFWSQATGAHVVYGAIGGKYGTTGSLTDAFGTSVQKILGLPTTDELATLNGGRVNYFQGGTIYWSPTTGAHVVYGAIGGEYEAIASLGDAAGRSVKGIIGLPISDEQAAPGRPGARVSYFQGGAIYWSPATGAHVAYGAIGGFYNANGASAGRFGLPLNDEFQSGNFRVVNFQFGNIAWSPATGAFAF